MFHSFKSNIYNAIKFQIFISKSMRAVVLLGLGEAELAPLGTSRDAG